MDETIWTTANETDRRLFGVTTDDTHEGEN